MMAFIRVIALALALAATGTWSSHPSESARNQYEAREDSPQLQLLTEATDHSSEVHMAKPHFIKNSTNSSKQLATSTDGFIQEKFKSWRLRRKRSYLPWSSRVVDFPSYPSLNVWRPHTNQIRGPYFIPVYGAQGSSLIFYPSQPFYENPGVPVDNPTKPFKGPAYLPPKRPTTVKPEDTSMTIDDRWNPDPDNRPPVSPPFNGGDNVDDRPVWPDSNQRPTTEVIPTRRPPRPGGQQIPPLIHKPTDPESGNEASVENEKNRFTTSAPITSRPTRPSNQQPPSNQRPTRPEPSRCVWAIISCCSSSKQISNDCFEQRGCGGPFWDGDPCESQYAQAAIDAALNYYNRK